MSSYYSSVAGGIFTSEVSTQTLRIHIYYQCGMSPQNHTGDSSLGINSVMAVCMYVGRYVCIYIYI